MRHALPIAFLCSVACLALANACNSDDPSGDGDTSSDPSGSQGGATSATATQSSASSTVGQGGAGASGAAGSGGDPSTTATGPASSSSTGNPNGCNNNGSCELLSGEICGECSDCTFDLIECGACMPPGCEGTDACTCPDCDVDIITCPDDACTYDGICEPQYENCKCADCENTMFCQ